MSIPVKWGFIPEIKREIDWTLFKDINNESADFIIWRGNKDFTNKEIEKILFVFYKIGHKYAKEKYNGGKTPEFRITGRIYKMRINFI